MIRVGNQTSFAATPTEPFDYARARRFDAFEWFPDKKPGAGWDASDLSAELRRQIRQQALDAGLRMSVHARWQANPLLPESAPLLEADLNLAGDLGAELFNIHFHHDQGLRAFLEAIAPLARQAADRGLKLAIENTPLHSPEQFNELFAAMQAAKRPEFDAVGMCFDLGHANLCAATRNDYLGFLDRLAEQVPIIHLHLHENWGDSDSHLVLFTGPSAASEAGIRGLLERLARRGFDGLAILEQWPQPPALLDRARDRLVQLWPKGGAVPRPAGRPRPMPSGAHEAGTALPAPAPASPPAAFVDRLAEANRRARSWREKLEAVSSLLSNEASPLEDETLAVLAVYCRFLHLGQIPCAEDGRHFRPGHHARIALEIRQALARRTTPAQAWLRRRILPWLPSSSPVFRTAEPLTRIRDIAHRNDIPAGLKQEIKHTLQNKLHRCAGPEDLATSGALLRRITAAGAEYPPAFVEEFKRFHEELEEFFSARSLDARLRALLPELDPDSASLAVELLNRAPDSSLAGQLALLRAVTNLRQRFSSRLEADTSPETLELWVTDIALEDFAFVVLSQLINTLAHGRRPVDWPAWLEAMRLALNHLLLSGIERGECAAIMSESRTWAAALDPDKREDLLRLKATVDRAQRLAEDYRDRILEQFAAPAERLGRAMNLPTAAVRAFCEEDLRAQIVFQLSKLTSGLRQHLRERLALPPWEVLAAGTAEGRLMAATSLDELECSASVPVILLLRNAAGDEEIPGAVRGIVVAHELPHLSHLAVRARQAGVVLATCAETDCFSEFAALAGRTVRLRAVAESVELAPAAPTDGGAKPRAARPVTPCVLKPEAPCIPLVHATVETAGGKASGLRKLAELALRNDAGFGVPPTLVVPFGVLEAGLEEIAGLKAGYHQRIQELAAAGTAEAASRLAQELRALVQQAPVPGDILERAASEFGGAARLMVRSSSNAEDLPGLAGAGLYESVANVAVAELPAAIRRVWASLWSRAAVLSRQAAAIPPDQAHMAVVLQPLLKPDLSFVLHTVHPMTLNERELYVEVTVGLGETLVSGAVRGCPYRLVCDKASGEHVMRAFASFSRAQYPAPAGGFASRLLDYSRVAFSYDGETRRRFARQVTAISRVLESAFGTALDVEGAVAEGQLWLLQARPQPGIGRGEDAHE